MELEFDFEHVDLAEFGAGADTAGATHFYFVPADNDVQAALQEASQKTWHRLQQECGEPARFEPAEKHSAIEYLFLPLDDELSQVFKTIHEAENLEINGGVLADTDAIFCYFARLRDNSGRRLTAIRRATQFKGVLKSRLLKFGDDTLKIVADKVFKLDNDFDVLVDSRNVHILRPSGFEFAGDLKKAILNAAPQNAKEIAKELPFVDFANVEVYTTKHARAARYLASIKSQGEMNGVDNNALEQLCNETGVKVATKDGKLVIASGHELGFLEVLDRRRYELNLTGAPEKFRATGRTKL